MSLSSAAAGDPGHAASADGLALNRASVHGPKAAARPIGTHARWYQICVRDIVDLER